ncbi:hypothetical protein K3495_g12762 [Podosphaera aphanis]|nr:hypothetical protein K3495_g12762 [Podosphaera aphanis]
MMNLSLKGIRLAIFPERTPVYATARTQYIATNKARLARYPVPGIDDKQSTPDNFTQSEPSDLCSLRKPNGLDKITAFGGSKITFVAILVLVQLWIVSGFLFGFTDTWQIMFQNASSIQVYITDILLIRQQQNMSRILLTTIAELQSRTQTCERLLSHISKCTPLNNQLNLEKLDTQSFIDDPPDTSAGRPSRIEYIWNCACVYVARALGSIWAFIIYWIGIGAWASLGPSLKYDDTWQLYINTATAVLLTFTSVFLQNFQQHQENELAKSMKLVMKTDALIEERLRNLTGDRIPNPVFTIPDASRSFIERQIDNFADIMGSGLGVTLSLIFTIIWISVGPLLNFEDNWWLIIGTFTGLVGFVDGFVLRSLYYREESHAKSQLESLTNNENRILSQLQLQNIYPEPAKLSLTDRLSLTISNACGHRYAPVVAVGTVLALLATASGMKWTEAGQLLCNTTTMILEGFLLLVLIQAHNSIYKGRLEDIDCFMERKETLDKYISTL